MRFVPQRSVNLLRLRVLPSKQALAIAFHHSNSLAHTATKQLKGELTRSISCVAPTPTGWSGRPCQPAVAMARQPLALQQHCAGRRQTSSPQSQPACVLCSDRTSPCRQRTGQSCQPHCQQPLVASPQAQPYQSAAFTSTDAAVLERPRPVDIRPDVQPPKVATERVGVLLLNLGGPETLKDVREFLYNLFSDDSIIRLPAQGAAACTCPCSEPSVASYAVSGMLQLVRC